MSEREHKAWERALTERYAKLAEKMEQLDDEAIERIMYGLAKNLERDGLLTEDDDHLLPYLQLDWKWGHLMDEPGFWIPDSDLAY